MLNLTYKRFLEKTNSKGLKKKIIQPSEVFRDNIQFCTLYSLQILFVSDM